MFVPGGTVQQNLTERPPTIDVSIHQEASDLFGCRRASGFPCQNHRDAILPKAVPETATAGGLAGTYLARASCLERACAYVSIWLDDIYLQKSTNNKHYL